MQDRVPRYPGRVTLTPVSGQVNTYDMVRADQPEQEGTPLNKDTLLKDATAAALGLSQADPTVDDALAKINTDKAGRNELGKVIYDGKKYELKPYGTKFFDSYVYLTAATLYANSKYTARFDKTYQNFYDKNTGELVWQSNMNLYLEEQGSPVPLNSTDDNLFVLRRASSYMYLFNPDKQLAKSLYYPGYYMRYAGSRNGAAYVWYYNDSGYPVVMKYALDTLSMSTSKTITISSYNYVSSVYTKDGYHYRIVNSNGSLSLEIIDFDTGEISVKPITSGVYTGGYPSLKFIDYDKSEFYFTISTESGIYKFCKFNAETGILTDIKTGMSDPTIVYLGSVDDDTILVRLADNYIYKRKLSDWDNPVMISSNTYTTTESETFKRGDASKYYVRDYTKIRDSALIDVETFETIYVSMKNNPEDSSISANIYSCPGGYVLSTSNQVESDAISASYYSKIITGDIKYSLCQQPFTMREVQ